MSEVEKKTATTGEVFKVYWSEARKHPMLLLAVFVGMAGAQIADLVAPLYMRDFLIYFHLQVPTRFFSYNYQHQFF